MTYERDNTPMLRTDLAAQIPAEQIRAMIARTELLADPVRIRTTPYVRLAFREVASGAVDVIAPERAYHADFPWPTWWAEVGVRKGKYDGAERTRYAIRPSTSFGLADPAVRWETAFLRAEPDPLDEALLMVQIGHAADLDDMIDGGDQDLRFFRRHVRPLDRNELERIVHWHAQRYFRHLAWDDVAAVARLWAIEHASLIEGWSLAQANRSADRALYTLSRQLGWRKLTRRERVGLWGVQDGPFRGQWHHESELGPLYEARGLSATGCGEATLHAARHGSWSHEAWPGDA